MLALRIVLSALASSSILGLSATAGVTEFESCKARLFASTTCTPEKPDTKDDCICNQDYHFQLGLLKCFHEASESTGKWWRFLRGCQHFSDNAAVLQTMVYEDGLMLITGMKPHYHDPPRRSVIPAASFSFPPCGMSCLAKAAPPPKSSSCSQSLTPFCVLEDFLDQGDRDGVDMSPIWECIRDTCDDVDVATSLVRFVTDTDVNTPSMLKDLFPYNLFLEVALTQGQLATEAPDQTTFYKDRALKRSRIAESRTPSEF